MFPHDFLGHEWLIWCDDGENYLVGLIICPSWILPPFFSPSFLACCLAQVAPYPIVTATHTYLSVSDWSLWHTPVHSLRRRSVSPPFIGRVNGQEDSICLSFSCLFFIRTWLHLDNRCLLINFAPVLTLGCIPSLSLRRKKSRPGCAVICYAVKRLMDVHLVFESSSYSSGACLLCTSRLQ